MRNSCKYALRMATRASDRFRQAELADLRRQRSRFIDEAWRDGRVLASRPNIAVSVSSIASGPSGSTSE